MQFKLRSLCVCSTLCLLCGIMFCKLHGSMWGVKQLKLLLLPFQPVPVYIPQCNSWWFATIIAPAAGVEVACTTQHSWQYSWCGNISLHAKALARGIHHHSWVIWSVLWRLLPFSLLLVASWGCLGVEHSDEGKQGSMLSGGVGQVGMCAQE